MAKSTVLGAATVDTRTDEELELGEMLPEEPKKPSPAIASNQVSGFSLLSWLALLALVMQNSTAVLIIRYTLIIPGERDYLPAVAIILSEVLKMTVSLLVVFTQHGSLASLFVNKAELAKSSVPALLYLLQNNLQYLAISTLHAGTYQTIYQIKVVTTAVVWVLAFRTSLGLQRWLSLLALLIGVSCVHSADQGSAKANAHVNLTVGVTATLAATLTSAFAGVYFEKLIKGSSTLSIWERNAQLGAYSVAFGLLGIAFKPESLTHVVEKGFLHGMTSTTFVSICIQGGGGLLIGLIMKYTNAIMKDMATTVSIVLTVFLSWIIFEQPVGELFSVGVVVVCGAVFAYARAK
eukprot:TRINITY_DN15357_c0_g1_i1.p1 TRINITY_DN15357_c0_g1~~TRINITY_DN15357_c0_g1_i1.p1  ORF type:complete len:374 (+),score=37.19 TRINITY_DN15357_c0_g1_i1:75-1124(+)